MTPRPASTPRTAEYPSPYTRRMLRQNRGQCNVWKTRSRCATCFGFQARRGGDGWCKPHRRSGRGIDTTSNKWRRQGCLPPIVPRSRPRSTNCSEIDRLTLTPIRIPPAGQPGCWAARNGHVARRIPRDRIIRIGRGLNRGTGVVWEQRLIRRNRATADDCEGLVLGRPTSYSHRWECNQLSRHYHRA